jgi:hypothetical protein
MKTAWTVTGAPSPWIGTGQEWAADDAFERATRKGLMLGRGEEYVVLAPGPHGAVDTNVLTTDPDVANFWAEILLDAWPNGFEKSWDQGVLPGMQAEHEKLLRSLGSAKGKASMPPAPWKMEMNGLIASVVFTLGSTQLLWVDGSWYIGSGGASMPARALPYASSMEEARQVGCQWLWDNNEPEEKTSSKVASAADIPVLRWMGGERKGSSYTAQVKSYSATLTLTLTPKFPAPRSGEPAYDWRAHYFHNPTEAEVEAGATAERTFLLDEGQCKGTGEWGSWDGSTVGPLWRELGESFVWVAARDAIPPFEWPDWVKAGP